LFYFQCGSFGLRGLKNAYGKDEGSIQRTERDLSLVPMSVIFVVCLGIMFKLYQGFIANAGLTFVTTILMFFASFLFVAVSSYIVGLVGSSNNPVSGMTISALLGTAIFFLVLGYNGNSAILATLGVAAVVCCAACTAGDCSQDLKTGAIIGATPKSQQIAQILGVVIPALVIAPVLSLLHNAYGIGTGLKAPQATLFASIAKGLFGNGELPYNMIAIGAVMGVIILIIDGQLKKNNSNIRLHLMPLAVGIDLPVTLAVPMLLGGIIRHFIDKSRGSEGLESEDGGVLLSSGLIAGEALMGVIIAVFLYFKVDLVFKGISAGLSEILSTIVILGVAYYLHKISKASN